MSTPSRSIRSRKISPLKIKNQWSTVNDAVDRWPAVLHLTERDVDQIQAAHRDDRSRDRKVVADQPLLRRITNDEQDDEVEAGHLGHGALAGDPKDEEQKAVDCDDTQEDAGRPEPPESRGDDEPYEQYAVQPAGPASRSAESDSRPRVALGNAGGGVGGAWPMLVRSKGDDRADSPGAT